MTGERWRGPSKDGVPPQSVVKVLWRGPQSAGTARRPRVNVFAIFRIALNLVRISTQRRCADGPEADLNLRMLDARFSPVSGHYQLDQSCPESARSSHSALSDAPWETDKDCTLSRDIGF
jgi:hypothetical protein